MAEGLYRCDCYEWEMGDYLGLSRDLFWITTGSF